MSDDLQIIKERIFDEEKIEFILEELECQNIKDVGERIEAQLPEKFDSDNRRAVQVYKSESLTSKVRSRGISGDIYALAGYILYGAENFEQVKENLYQIKTYLCNILGWDEYLSSRGDFEDEREKVDYLSFLRPIQKERKKRERIKKLEHKENKTISEKVLNRYFDYAHHEFLKDGISVSTQKEFGVMFDRESERIIYPVHNKHGELIGVKGRYIGKNKRVLKEKKYMYLHRCDKSLELWNYYSASPHVKECGEVIVFESEKSVMLAWQWGYKNAVAIGGSELSPVQAMLLKQLEANIIFAFDKDVEKENVKKQTKQIKTRVCKAVIDKDDMLEGKNSPVDKGKEIWEKLYKEYKISIN